MAMWRKVGVGVVVAASFTAAVGCSDDGDGAPKGELIGSGDRYEATIRRVEGGVPHITGESLTDVTFGQGWASGEDRTCDLADQVIKIRGERASWFGAGDDDANIDSDIAWRTIGIYDRAKADWDDVSDEVRDVVTAFVAGWNGHLTEVGRDDIAGWCAGEDWVEPIEPVDVYAYARSIALYASGAQLTRYIAAAHPPGEDPATTSSTNVSTTSTNASTSTTTAPADDDDVAAGAPSMAAGDGLGVLKRPMASNGWGIGAERSAEGGGLLLANPHFPWEGELRFWESHLEVPGEVDAYGVQLSGLPGIGIGFNESVGWTHTVSAGNRFATYQLRLVPGKPTTYFYGDEQRDMTSTDITIEVKGDDGETSELTRTMWSSHYGPIIDVRAEMDIPQLGWTETSALTYRDANFDNDEILDQYLAMVRADGMDDFIDAHREHQGIPLFNTIAVDKTGRAWYADTSATPNLSDEAIAAFDARVESDLLVSAAADNGLVLLDGSDPANEWVEEDGARDPGLVPFDRMPMVERDDYVFNANDSYWLPHATERLEGDYSPLHGRPETPRTPRTRENAVVLDDTSADGASGADGKFDLDELTGAALLNEGFTARALRDEVVAGCEATPSIDVPALTSEADGAGNTVLPAATIDLTKACEILDAWDGRYDLDSRGAVLFREMLAQFPSGSFTDKGELWAEPFDPADPVQTPKGLNAEPQVLVNLARSTQVLDLAGLALDVPLGDVQFSLRDGERIPIHGGNFGDGTTNVVGRGGRLNASILDDDIADLPTGTYAEGTSSQLAAFDDQPGYGVNFGTSFLMALAFTDDGPQAEAFLTYGNTEDRSSPLYTEATENFSKKQWRHIPLTEDAIQAEATSTVTVRG